MDARCERSPRSRNRFIAREGDCQSWSSAPHYRGRRTWTWDTHAGAGVGREDGAESGEVMGSEVLPARRTEHGREGQSGTIPP